MSVIISSYGVFGPFKTVAVTAEGLVGDNTLYPLHILGEYSVSEDDSLAPSAITKPAKTLDQLKAERQAKVDALVVTTATGKVFDGGETAQSRMARAILAADITGLAECEWVLADNTVATVSRDDLAEALALSMQAMGAIWADPYRATETEQLTETGGDE